MDLFLLAALLCYLASAFYAVIVFAAGSTTSDGRVVAIVGVGFLAHTASFVVAWTQLGRFPIVSAKEVCSFVGWAIVAYFLVLRARYKTRALSTILLPLIFVVTLISLLLPEASGPISPLLEGAIDASTMTRVIFPLHVSLLIFSYAAFLITTIGGVMYLIQERELKAKSFSAAFYRLPALNTCDEIGYRSVTIGFVLLTLGMVTGIIWNSQRDGKLWHNDPKEVLALVTWCVYLFMIHYRVTAGWRGRKTAWIAIAGFVVVLFTWIGARYLPGYHVFG
jgi:cytochrome c-type biogenesis protein CcsB